MEHDTNMAIEAAAARAEAVRQAIAQQNGDLEPAYRALEEAIGEFEQTSGEFAEALVPAEDEAGLRFRRTRRGQDFWAAYKKRLRKQLCDPKGELHWLSQAGTQITGTAIVTAMVNTLALPIALLPVLGPMVGIILHTGVDAFCDATDDKPNESR
jgi:hypothetical protein